LSAVSCVIVDVLSWMAPTVAKDHSEHHPVDAMLNVHHRCWNGLQATCPLISSRAAAALTWTWRQAWRLVTSPHHLVMEMSAGWVTGTHSAGVIGSRWRWWAAVRQTSNRPSSDVTHWLLVSSSLTVRCWNPRQCITAFKCKTWQSHHTDRFAYALSLLRWFSEPNSHHI